MKREDFKLGTVVKIANRTIAEVDYLGAGTVWLKIVGDTTRAYMDFNLKENRVTLCRYFGGIQMKSVSIPISAFTLVTPNQNVEAIKAETDISVGHQGAA